MQKQEPTLKLFINYTLLVGCLLVQLMDPLDPPSIALKDSKENQIGNESNVTK